MTSYGYYHYNAYHLINAYLWHELQESGLMIEDEYSWHPIVPVMQVPQFMELNPNKAFIVYAPTRNARGFDWFYDTENIAYTVYSPNPEEVVSIVNLIDDVFKREDQSAFDIAQFKPRLTDERLKRFLIHHTEVLAQVPLAPYEQEKGRYNGMITIRYSYTEPKDDNGRRTLAL
jgi:hypothetical protein